MSEPHKIELDTEEKEWLGKMTAEERLELIREICVDWDGYRDADHLGDLLNEVWIYAAFPVAKKDPQSARELKTAYWVPSSFDGYADGAPVIDAWQCSGCCEEFDSEGDPPTYDYCPYCGARFIGIMGGKDNEPV